jgi:hypothetical protein
MAEAGTVFFSICPGAMKWIPKAYSLWVKQPEQEVWSSTCLPLYAFMVWCLAP